MTSHSKIAQFNWECIAPFTGHAAAQVVVVLPYKVANSIPEVTTVIDLVSNRNEYHEYFLGVKVTGT